MPELWNFENYTPDNHNQLIADLKKENEELKAMLSSSQTLCLLVKENLDKRNKEFEVLQNENIFMVGRICDLRTCWLENNPPPPPVVIGRDEGPYVDRPGDINEDGAKLCDTCREELHWDKTRQIELCSCDEDPLPPPPPRREHRRASP